MRRAVVQIGQAKRAGLGRSDFVVNSDAGTEKECNGEDGEPEKAGAYEEEWLERNGLPVGFRGGREFAF